MPAVSAVWHIETRPTFSSLVERHSSTRYSTQQQTQHQKKKKNQTMRSTDNDNRYRRDGKYYIFSFGRRRWKRECFTIVKSFSRKENVVSFYRLFISFLAFLLLFCSFGDFKRWEEEEEEKKNLQSFSGRCCCAGTSDDLTGRPASVPLYGRRKR